MLTVVYKPDRPVSEGRYKVILTKYDFENDVMDRLSYHCDQRHLAHFAHEVLHCFGYDYDQIELILNGEFR
jgi:hypothetical protein